MKVLRSSIILKSYIYMLLVVCSINAFAASICADGIESTSVTEDFTETSEEDGAPDILHLPSNLIFTRCSLGQTWDGETCTGTPTTFTWAEAVEASRNFELNGQKNWRLPNLKELSVIVERACVRPSINEQIFPVTPADEYWTSTASIEDENSAWLVGFNNGTNTIKDQQSSLYVRLVRYNH